MKKILIAITLALTFCLCKQHSLNIYNYADLVASYNKVNILVNGDLEASKYYFYSDKNNPIPTIEIFRKMVELKGLKLLKGDDFYFIYNPYNEIASKDYIDFDDFIKGGGKVKFKESGYFKLSEKLRYIRLKNNSYEEVNKVLSTYEKNATFIAKDNAVSFRADDELYSQVLEVIEKFDDKKLNQVTFKVTIIETDLNHIRDLGSEINSLLKIADHSDLGFFINLISAPYKVTTNLIKDKKEKFYSVLNFLDTNNISSIKSAPFLTAKSNNKAFFSVVENVPYLVNKSSYNSNGVSSQNSYEYKDVGLKLSIRPIIFKDYVDLDLHLIYDNLIDSVSLTPITKKKELKSNYTLNKGEILVLSGINQETEITYQSGVPFLKDIFLLKYIFGFESKKKLNSVLTITLEVV